MSVAARYVNKELIAIFAVTASMLLLVAVGGRFIGYLQEAALGKFTGTTVLTIMGLRLPEFTQLVAPFSIYLGVVLTLGRLYADQEMVVLQGAGAGTRTLLGWVAVSVLTVVLFVALLSCYVTPMSQRVLVDFMAQQRAQSEFETVNPGTFHIYDRGRRVTYSRDMSDDRRTLYDVFISQRLEDGRQVTLWAAEGRQQVDPISQAHYLILNDGRRYEGTPGQPDFQIMAFAELSQRLSEAELIEEALDVEAQSFFTLGQDPESRGEWHWRIGLPIFCLVGGLLAVGIARVNPRQGRFAKVVPGMLLMLSYYLVLLTNKFALVEGIVPAAAGLWLAHLIFVGIAAGLLTRLGKPIDVQ